MREVVEVIVMALVEHPEQVKLTETVSEHETLVELTVAQEDMGRIIGRQGRIAKAIRTVLKAAATKQKTYVNLNIIDP